MFFFDLNRDDLDGLFASQGVSRVHLPRMFRHVYRDGHDDPSLTPHLPKTFASYLRSHVRSDIGKIEKALESAYDHSVKLLIRWNDGALVEAVIMPESKRITLCLSSQVGCRQACSFCYTGRMGLIRNLTAGEIVGQYVLASKWLSQNSDWFARAGIDKSIRLSNIVFMGMGEPLDNLSSVDKAISIFTEPYGLCISAKKVSLSTAGHVPGLLSLAKKYPTLSFAVSLHATTDRERSQLMPINRRWSLSELMDAVNVVASSRRQGVLIQYTVIAGVNDRPEHAARLIELLQGRRIKLNLIPLNEIAPTRFQSPESQSLENFRDTIHAAGIRVLVRYSKGQDIGAACGQLVDRHQA